MEHSKRSHAILSASGSHRWLHCTPSALLEDKFGEKIESEYAKEGTLAHELSELYIKKDILEEITEDVFDAELEKIMSNELFTPDMIDNVIPYIDYIDSQFSASKQENMFAKLMIEQSLDLRDYIPDGFGTADAVIICDGTMQVIDLKYGKGVPVYATHNTQLMIYGLGALSKFGFAYDINTVELTIVQPRIDNISSFKISVDDLLDWATNVLKKAADLAIRGLGDLKAGDWCRFCSVKNRCKALSEEQLEIAKYEFRKPEFLSDDEIADILARTPKLIEWANSICEYANDKAVKANKKWPGYKLVEGTSRRKWLNEDEVVDFILKTCPEYSKDELINEKPKSLTEIEKLFGKAKFRDKLSSIVVKPQGKPILVPDDDKRPALGLQQAQIDFKG